MDNDHILRETIHHDGNVDSSSFPLARSEAMTICLTVGQLNKTENRTETPQLVREIANFVREGKHFRRLRMAHDLSIAFSSLSLNDSFGQIR
jgi:hypothetical protein